MTGRGIDQVLPHPFDPAIHEPYVKNAKDYVQLAESANGPIPKPVSFSYNGEMHLKFNLLKPGCAKQLLITREHRILQFAVGSKGSLDYFFRSFMIDLQKSGRSSGEREVTMFPSVTAASSTTLAPAFLRSVLTDGQLVAVFPLTMSASISI